MIELKKYLEKKIKVETIFGKNSDLELINHFYRDEYQILYVKYKSKIIRFRLNLIGKVQIKNIMMAILAAVNSNLNMKNIVKIIDKIKSVEGRFEKIGLLKNNSKVILDYAHTPDALKTVLKNIKDNFH